ncbi:MAG: uroporphyrinogen decarboxylase family protein [Clostridiaceae bacterium]
MSKKDEFINYVRNGGGSICSPQIGAGAGFDTKLQKKRWISDTTLDDTISAVEMFNMHPLLNAALCDLGSCNPAIAWEGGIVSRDEYKILREFTLKTPVGMLQVKSVEEMYNAPFNQKYAITGEDDLDPFEYYLDAVVNSDFSYVTKYVKNIVDKINGRAALSIQWAMQPYEMLCFPNTIDTVMLSMDYPERFKALMDKIVKLDEKLIEAVARGGADFVFLGAPGVEMLSPMHYENYIIPYSQIVASIAHSRNLMIYSHICSPIEPFLSKGYYNKMGIDLFETLSPPPVGNIASLEDALTKIDTGICTRGNIGLDILLNSEPDKIKEEVYKIIKASKGRKHIVAASDYLFYQTPEENVHAMCEAVKS